MQLSYSDPTLSQSDHTPDAAHWGATCACIEQGSVSCEPGTRKISKECHHDQAVDAVMPAWKVPSHVCCLQWVCSWACWS